MIIIPAIDLIDGCAVRLQKGEYDKKTVYSDKPWEVACGFKDKGAKYLHLVDLDGALSGKTDNFKTVEKIISHSSLFTEVGGGIRDTETVARYLDAGVSRIILGTAAVKNPEFLDKCLEKWGDKIAVGIDIKDGYVAIKGWTEVTSYTLDAFFDMMQKKSVSNIICTDISKDGMMSGTNLEMYKELQSKFTLDITASGGVSSIDDIKALKSMDMYAAILGKALYTGAIDLECALEVANGN